MDGDMYKEQKFLLLLKIFLLTALLMPGVTLAQVDLSSLQSVNADVTTAYVGFNRRTGEMSYNATITNNTSQAISGPIYLEISNITPAGISVVNADDTSTAATPLILFNVSNLDPVNVSNLDPGQSSTRPLTFLNPTRARFDFTSRVFATPAVDTTPPNVSITSPTDGTSVTDPQLLVSGNASDDVSLSGVTVNGVAASLSGGSYSATITLTQGSNVVTAIATDSSGNTANASINVTLQLADTTPPVISISSPTDGSTLTNANQTVSGNVSDNIAVQGVTVNNVAASVNGGSYSADIVLTEGANTITAVATDTSGNTAAASINVTLNTSPVDTQGPTLSIVTPANGGLVISNQPVITLSYADPSGVDTASIALAVNGSPITANCSLNASGGSCTPDNALAQGSNTVSVTIADTLGNTASQQVQFIIDSQPPQISITTPVDGFITKNDSIVVSGTAGAGVDSVSVNGVAATLAGSSFSATVPLREGRNTLVALATKASGRTATASIEVTRDIFAPIVRIDSPRNGFIAVNNIITVTGQVNDIVNGATNPRVFVNGIEATVAGGAFMALDIPLVRGNNTIQAIATDAAGNEGRHTINVTFQPVVGVRLSIASGNGQSALVNAPLNNPLVVTVRDNLGNPVAGRVVTFRVTRNSGLLGNTAAAAGQRMLQLPTNGSGQAQVFFKLGDTAGEGNNRVNVTALGVTGEVEFCASALAQSADNILAVDGDNQRGVVGNPLAEPLAAMVVDKDGNPVNGIDVTFNVVTGTGSLDGATSIVKTTGTDGIARAVFTLGQEAGINNNIVNARFAGQPADRLAATYAASGLLPGNPADTRFSGVVLDNSHTPIPGTVVTIPGTSVTATTNTDGQFLLNNVPVGHIHLHIDPANSPRTETFPPLDFETVTVAGQTNILGQPILLPVVETASAKIVGGAQDVTLTMPNVPGLALTVFANSVTFPDGAKTGLLSISQVQLDKIPMPPPNGTIFMPPAWTIQPSGVHFDPPARITIPNNGLLPGRVIDIYQFDHALNEFISIGKGTVTDDGFAVVSDPGFGITRAGWGGGGPPPPPTNCPNNSNDPFTDPNVRMEFEDAWNDSNPGTGTDPNRREQGGWIVRNSDGSFSVSRWPPGTASGISPTPVPSGSTGSFHTHPNMGTAPNGQPWNPRPSPSDVNNVRNNPVYAPHYVISDKNIYRINADGTVDDLGPRTPPPPSPPPPGCN